MTTKHTPGPWKCHRRGAAIPTVRAGDERGVDGGHVASCACYDHAEEAEANARLIAAAPDLLAACEALVADAETGHTTNWELIEKAKAAIARARG